MLSLFKRMLKLSVWLGALAPLSGWAQAPCGAQTVIGDVNSITLSFQVCGDSFVGTATARGTGWVAVGFSTDQYMPGTDVFMGGVLSNGSTYGSDRFAYFRSPPVVDTQQDARLLAASQANGFTSFTFSRPLSTGDDMDYDLTVGAFYILLAYHETSDALTDRHTFADPSDIAYVFAPVPEPQTALTLALGLGALGAWARRRRAHAG
jgi:hypothetical protein